MKKNHWFQLEGHPEIQYGQYLVPNFISNTFAIRCKASHWIVISPGASLLDSFKRQYAVKDMQLSLIFPNHFHYMGAHTWLDAFPEAKLYSSQAARARLERKGFEGIIPLEDQLPALPTGYSILFPPGHRGGDIWIQKADENDTIWITCDSFLNYDRVSNQPIARALQKILGAAPGLKMSQVIKWALINDRKHFKAWALEQITSQKPTILMPSHGEIDTDANLSGRIYDLIDSRL